MSAPEIKAPQTIFAQADDTAINTAARIIREGGLVAFPTETVYGLGADSFNEAALKNIYRAKNRPSDNPLILHIYEKAQAFSVCDGFPEAAERLTEAYWPGPLTVILKKKPGLPGFVSSGLNTISLRLPENTIARRLIKASGTPISAPSANSSGKPSPTRASHVLYDLGGKIDMILDGGACDYGLESTIVDFTGDVPCLLRPGSITREMITDVIGEIQLDSSVIGSAEPPRAPGMKYTHYSPLADVTVFMGEATAVADEITSRLRGARLGNPVYAGKKLGVMATEQTKERYAEFGADVLVLVVGDRNRPASVAANLFKILRNFDYYGVDVVFAEGFAEDGEGLAIMNRLKKAAGNNIVQCHHKD